MDKSAKAGEVEASLERFSSIIMDTLKELSRNRKPLSVSFLSKALGERREIVDLLVNRNNDNPTPPAASVPYASVPEEEAPASQLNESPLGENLSKLNELGAENARLRAFLKRSFLILIALSSSTENAPYYDSLNRLKKLVLEDADLHVLDNFLSTLKSDIYQRDLGVSESEPQTGKAGSWAKWLKRKGSASESDTPKEGYIKKLQGAFLSILAEFHVDFGKEYLDRFSVLQQRLRESEDPDRVLSMSGDIVSIIQSYTRLMSEERNQVTEFITEISNGLIDMETHFLASLTQASQAHEANSSFSRMLEGHMEEIGNSTHISKTLAEFKGLVFSKLSAIRAALETKREQDQRRIEEINREMGTLQENIQSMKNEIVQVQEQTKSLEKETLLDPLTGIPNRRAYDGRLREEFQRYDRYRQSFSLLLFDVDHFKRVNDNYGHWAGDKCLKEIINRIKPTLRESDFLARYGGEEFIVILPGTERESALGVAERLCQLIDKTHFLFKGEKIPLTISVGVTQVTTSDGDQDELFNRVDKAMYEAKKAGRNRVVWL